MSKVYKAVISVADRFVPGALRPMWDHPAGPKTIFFWAPACKWSLVIAGLGDINRPVEKLSVRQCSSLAITGIIWSRYSLIIIPKNLSLFAVNVFVALTNVYQLGRVYKYQTEMEAKKVGKGK
ncbi:mitochondrial pyruvate carrier 2 isoform X1 [Spodoptera frugiperda]|uniref:Mitochondrial pyruvate carrier n=1 Tax=Spodoptera frugiperda TaxID=7108 RepID=A0A9R0DHC7_SPOFR|nr:mitochondrial pyruvate carrier 2 isoform X1 [Spodoptera frugiperda]